MLVAMSSLAVFALALSGCATAVTQGTIEGTVYRGSDSSPIPGVRVSAIRDSTEFAVSITNAQGGYKLTSLEPGEYVVVARMAGFQEQSFPVTVRAGGGKTVRNFYLETGG